MRAWPNHAKTLPMQCLQAFRDAYTNDLDCILEKSGAKFVKK